MNTTKLLTGTVVGTVTGMIASMLVFGFILSGYMAENTNLSPEPDMIWLAVGHLFFALLITYVFLQWAHISTPVTGAKAGAILGFLMTLSMDLIYFSMSDMFPGGVLVPVIDALGSAVVWAIGGAAIGWVLGRGNSVA